jgi:hypothetical protein
VFAFYRRHPALLVLAGEQTGATDQEIATDFDNVITGTVTIRTAGMCPRRPQTARARRVNSAAAPFVLLSPRDR